MFWTVLLREHPELIPLNVIACIAAAYFGYCIAMWWHNRR